jgi:hypothetical protein
MSALNGLAENGAIPVGSGPVVAWRNGLPFNALGELVVTTNVPTHWSNGVGFQGSAVSALVGGVTVSWSCGLPFNADGKLCIDSLGPDHWSSGTPFNAVGQVTTD